MSKILTKNGFRGFTLIELLVVIAIIGLLSTVIAAPITQARKKGRDGKKVADLHQIQGALQQYADDHLGNFPPLIDSLVPVYLSNMPTFATSTAPSKDRFLYTTYGTSDDRVTSFHIGSKLEAPSLALADDRDCFAAGPITSGGANYCIDNSTSPNETIYGTSTNYSINSYASDQAVPGMTPTANFFLDAVSPAVALSTFLGNDFGGGSDAGNTACTASLTASGTACIYDITN